MKILYVMPEYPSVTHTFVANEAAAVRRLGVDVIGYALQRGSAARSASEVPLLCGPPGRMRLLAAAAAHPLAILGQLWRARCERPSLRELARLALASAHATHVAGPAARAGVTHIHAHFLARPADVASALARDLRRPWSATAHGRDVYAPREPALLRQNLRSIAAVACANRGLVSAIRELNEERTVPMATVHCGVQTAELAFPADLCPPEPPHLVTVGRLVATKGYWTILEAADTLMRRDPALRWTIVGQGPLRAAIEADERFQRLSPRLRLVGALDHEATLDVLRDGATAFVMPCERSPTGESDGIPVAFMEAMALGVPVVTCAVGGIAELVEEGQTGFLVEPRDSPALVAAVEHVLHGDPAELDRVRRAARKRIEDEFEINGQAQVLVSLLSSAAPGDADGASRVR